MTPGSRPTAVPSGILIYPAVWPQKTGPRFVHSHAGKVRPQIAKVRGCCTLSVLTSWVSFQHNVASTEAYPHTQWYRAAPSHLAITDMDRKVGGVVCPFSVRGAGCPSNTMSYQVAS